MNAPPLLSVRGLGVRFGGAHGVQAISDLGFDLAAGEVLGLLGESGSGKSVTLRALLRLHAPPHARLEGAITFDGADLLALDAAALRRLRGGAVAMVFQEPGLAFDPVYTIGSQIAEVVRAHERVDAATARQRARHLLDRVQVPQAARRLHAYPHELSGGLRQRAMIALALACGPKLLLADEPTTALDATVQMQILLLLRELQRETGMAMIFVSHDIGAALEVADRIAVMYAGRIVEDNAAAAIVARPRHPYTAALLAASAFDRHRGGPLPAIPGMPPDLAALPAGCAYAPRCAYASARCREQRPLLVRGGATARAATALACWHPPAASDGGGPPPA